MMNRKDIEKMTDTTRGMAEAQRKAQEAAAENFMSMQQRSVQVARDGLKVIELQRDNMDAARDLWSSGMKFASIQQRNADFAQRWMSGAAVAMRGQAEQNVRTAEVFANSVREQQESFRSLTRMWAGAYQDYFSSFAGYARQATETAKQATEQGIENTRQATEQGMRLVDDAAEATSQAVSQNENGSQSKVVAALEDGSYDDMNVGDISRKLDSLSEEDLKKVRTYEKLHKNRETLVGQIDRKIKANS